MREDLIGLNEADDRDIALKLWNHMGNKIDRRIEELEKELENERDRQVIWEAAYKRLMGFTSGIN